MAVASRPLRAARAWARVRRVLLDPRGSEPIAIPVRTTRVAAHAPHLRQGCSGCGHDVRLEGSSCSGIVGGSLASGKAGSKGWSDSQRVRRLSDLVSCVVSW